MKQVSSALCGLFCLAGAALAANPVPFVNQPLVPGAAVPGGPAFTLTVNGCMFVSGATVNWNGQPLATTFVSESRLTASVPASDIATASTASITVANPDTAVASNIVLFQVTTPESMVYYQDAPGYPTGFGDPGAPEMPSVINPPAVGDFLDDGRQDLAFVGGSGNDPSNNGLDVLLGSGDGTFRTLPMQPPNQLEVTNLAEGDFNGNGRLDLAVMNWTLNTVTVMLNNGDGTFSVAPGSPIGVGPAPTDIAIGDFNRDGNLDLAVMNSDILDPNSGGAASSVTILLGNGDGSFTEAPGSPYTGPPFAGSPAGAEFAAAGDFNGDGSLDVAVVDGPSVYWLLLGKGNGTFTEGEPFYVPGFFKDGPGLPDVQAVAAGDFNGDGRLDLAAAGTGWYAVNVLLGNGDGTFTYIPKCCSFGDNNQTYNNYMAMGDFNGDGKLDLALHSSEQTSQTVSFIQILLGSGDGTFEPTDYAVLMSNSPEGIAAGDFNHSGRLGMVATAGVPQGMWSFVQVPPSAWAYPPPNFTITAKGSALTVKAGDTVTDDLTVSSQYGFYGEIKLPTCTGAPAQSTCTVSWYVSGPYNTDRMILPMENLFYSVSIATTAPSNGSSSVSPLGPSAPAKQWPGALWAAAAFLTLGLAAVRLARQSARARALLLAAALLGLGMAASCGSGPPKSAPSPPPAPIGGTPPGTYTIVVTAASPSGGGLAHSVPITLTVQ